VRISWKIPDEAGTELCPGFKSAVRALSTTALYYSPGKSFGIKRHSPGLIRSATGKSNKDVANLPNLSVYTVETHQPNIIGKLNLGSVPELTYSLGCDYFSTTHHLPAGWTRSWSFWMWKGQY